MALSGGAGLMNKLRKLSGESVTTDALKGGVPSSSVIKDSATNGSIESEIDLDSVDSHGSNDCPNVQEPAKSQSKVTKPVNDCPNVQEPAKGQSKLTKPVKPNNVEGGECCGKCKNALAKCKPKGSVVCWMCKVNFCLGCTNFKAQALSILSRNDVMYMCPGCLPKTESIKIPPGDKPVVNASLGDIGEKYDALKGEFDGLKQQVIEAMTGMNEVSQNLQTNLRSILTETLFGDEFPEFDPSISHVQAKKIAKEHNKPEPPTLQSVMHSTAVAQKKEEQQEEVEKSAARNNIMIYGMPEREVKDFDVRKKINEDLVKELFTAIDQNNIKPLKMHRIGKFNQDAESPRPLKVYLPSVDVAINIIKSCKKLQSADQHLKQLSVSHDLTREERSNLKSMVTEAKNKSNSSPNWDFKVTGLPWKPEIQRFRKKEATNGQ